MLTNRTLARINNRPRKVGRLPLLAVGGGTLALAALLYVFGILPPLRHPRRRRRGRSAHPPALHDAEGEDDHLPLLQGQPRRRGRLPLLRGARSPGGLWLLRRGSGASPIRQSFRKRARWLLLPRRGSRRRSGFSPRRASRLTFPSGVWIPALGASSTSPRASFSTGTIATSPSRTNH